MHRLEKEIAEIKEFIQQQIVNGKEIFTLAEAAMYLGVSKSLLYKLTSQRRIPHYKPGSKIIFIKKKDLENWVLNSEVSTIEKLGTIENKELKVVKVL